jgi:hypothetical protein
MEGARWDIDQGIITDSRLKELYPGMPVINVRVSVTGFWREIHKVTFYFLGHHSRQARPAQYVRLSSL